MVEGLNVVSGRVLQLLNLSSVRGRAFKYKENNLGVLYKLSWYTTELKFVERKSLGLSVII